MTRRRMTRGANPGPRKPRASSIYSWMSSSRSKRTLDKNSARRTTDQASV